MYNKLYEAVNHPYLNQGKIIPAGLPRVEAKPGEVRGGEPAGEPAKFPAPTPAKREVVPTKEEPLAQEARKYRGKVKPKTVSVFHEVKVSSELRRRYELLGATTLLSPG